MVPVGHVIQGTTMSVVKRGNSKYWYIHFQLNGQTYIRSSRTTNNKAAEQMENQLKFQIHSEQFLGRKPRISIRAAIDQYGESRKGMPSYPGLLYCAKSITRLLNVNKYLDELTSHDLERFKRDRMAEGVTPQTIKHNFNLIRGAWKLARKLGYQVNDLEFPQMKLPKMPLRYLTAAEEQRLLDCLDPKREGSGLRPFDKRDDEMKRALQDAYDLVVLLLDTGARYSEIANIEWPRINLDDRTINLWRSKVQNETVLYMTDRAYDVLSRRMQTRSGQYVFQSRNGGSRGYASQSIRKALRKADLHDCRIHTLRHTHASRLIQNGMSVYEVREILGHSDIKTTMRYAHLEAKQVTSKARDVINQLNQKANGSKKLELIVIEGGKTVEAQESQDCLPALLRSIN
jgi:integrase